MIFHLQFTFSSSKTALQLCRAIFCDEKPICNPANTFLIIQMVPASLRGCFESFKMLSHGCAGIFDGKKCPRSVANSFLTTKNAPAALKAQQKVLSFKFKVLKTSNPTLSVHR